MCIRDRINSTASALDLDVESDLNEFAAANKLSSTQIKNLKNPFFIEIETDEISDEIATEENYLTEEFTAVEESNQVEETVSEPEIVIDGVIKAANSRMALIVSYNQDKHLLKIGDMMNGYRLSSYQNGEAVFIKNGSSIRVKY